MNTHSKAVVLAASLIGTAFTLGACGSGGDAPRQDMSSMQRPGSVSESAPARSGTATAPTAPAGQSAEMPAQTARADTSMPRAPAAAASPSAPAIGGTGATGGAGTMDQPRPRQSRG